MNAKPDAPRNQLRHYRVTYQDKAGILDDYLDSFLKMLTIEYEEKLPNNTTMLFRVTDAVKQ